MVSKVLKLRAFNREKWLDMGMQSWNYYVYTRMKGFTQSGKTETGNTKRKVLKIMLSERPRDNFYIYTQEDGWRKMMEDGGFKSLVEVGE